MQKNHIFKRLTSGLLALVLLVSLMPAGIFRVKAAETSFTTYTKEFDQDGATYRIEVKVPDQIVCDENAYTYDNQTQIIVYRNDILATELYSNDYSAYLKDANGNKIANAYFYELPSIRLDIPSNVANGDYKLCIAISHFLGWAPEYFAQNFSPAITFECDISLVDEISVITNTAEVTLDNSTLDIGGTAAASVVVKDSEGIALTPVSVSWASSNSAIAAVDTATGVVTAKAPGTATITATATLADGTEVTGSVSVTVNVPAITVSPSEITLEEGQTAKATATVEKAPDGATVSWSSSDKAVATVDMDGTIHAIASGSATITATLVDTNGNAVTNNGTEVKATVNVTVTKVAQKVVLYAEINNATLKVGDTATITPTVKIGEDTTDYASGATISWSSANEKVATVSNGVVTAVDGGTTRITATITKLEQNGESVAWTSDSVISVEIEVTVVKATLNADPSAVELIIEENTPVTVDLSYVVVPSGTNLTNPKLEIKTGPNTSVATVSTITDGKVTVTPVAKGSTSFIVTLSADNITTVEVEIKVDVISQNEKGWVQVSTAGDSGIAVYKRLTLEEFRTSYNGWNYAVPVIILFGNGGQYSYSVGTDNLIAQSVTVTPVTIDGVTYYKLVSDGDIHIWYGAISGEYYIYTKNANDEYRALSGADGNLALKPSGQEGHSWTIANSPNTGAFKMYYNGYVVTVENGSLKLVSQSNYNPSADSSTATDMYVYAPTDITVSATDTYAKLENAGETVKWTVENFANGNDPLAALKSTYKILLDDNEDHSSILEEYLTLDASGVTCVLTGAQGTTVSSITKTGTYTLTVSYGGQTLGTITINVADPAVKIAISEDTLAMNKGTSQVITPKVYLDGSSTPLDASAFTAAYTWQSSNSGVVGVNAGTVYANADGTATVTATLSSLAVNGIAVQFEATARDSVDTVDVTVATLPSISLNTQDLSEKVVLDARDETQKTALIDLAYIINSIPDDATITEVTYDFTNSGEAYVTVSVNENTLKLQALQKTDAPVEVTVKLKTATASNGDTVILAEPLSYTFQVEVTDNLAEPYEITLNAESVTLILDETFDAEVVSVLQGTKEIENYQVTWSVKEGTDIVSVNEDGTVTALAEGTAVVVAAVPYTDLYGNPQTATAEINVVVSNRASMYSVEVTPEEKVADIGSTVALKAKFSTVDPEYTGTPEITWRSSNTDIATVDENGVVTVVGYGEVTITASAKVDDALTVSDSAKINVVKAGIELGIGYTAESGYVVPEGTAFTIVPYVDLANEFSNYQVKWTYEMVEGSGKVTFANETTFGGLSDVDADTNLQYIYNAKQTVTADTVGKVKITATLVDVNGNVVSNVSDSVYVTIVEAAADSEKMKADDFYSRETRLFTPTGAEGEKNPYELRILDQHTFLPDTNGLDARIGAVAGDTRVDFSQVKVAVYKNGELLLDSDGNPFIIPTSELSFYDVSTKDVGWVKVRVTYKDYYPGQITLFNDGSTSATTVSGYFYDEYSTGEGGTDGYVWMYVRPKETWSTSATVYVDGVPVVVTMNVEEVRPWLGESTAMASENWADATPFYRQGDGTAISYTGSRLPKITFTYTYNGIDYLYTNDPDIEGETGDIWGSCPVEWTALATGALAGIDSEVRQDQFSAEANVAEPDIPAYGELILSLKGVKLEGVNNGNTVFFDTVSREEIPILVRDNSVYEKTQMTFGYTPSWGGQATAYKSFLGGIPITAYAISYVADLSEDHFQIGLTSVPKQMDGGDWPEWFSLNVPLGTTAVETTFHTVTRSDGVVFIFNPDEDVAKVNYTIELDPQMLVLSAAGETIEGYSNTGKVQATVRDSEGNLISETAEVTVQWTMRNTAIASALEDVISNPFSISADTGTNISASDSFVGPYSNNVEVAGQVTGVTYLTVQLMSIKFADGTVVDASNQGIADYAIIYVIDKVSEKNMSVVVDYGKPIDISLQPLIDAENEDYNFIGFSDLQHSLRQNAVTTYGDISIEETVAHYVQSQIMDGVDEIYVIFQYIDPETGKYLWHHHLLNIIPATVMYYETDFADGIFTTEGDWSTVGAAVVENQDSYVQGNDTYGYDSSYDAGYGVSNGYDSSYDADYGVSNGSSLFVHGQGEDVTTASFTFTGTGFDIIGRTGPEQGSIRVKITGTKTDSDGKVYENTQFLINKGVDELYQLPLISVNDLEHDTYTVTIGVFEKVTYTGTLAFLSRGDEFYFDAIRIHGTLTGDEILVPANGDTPACTVNDVYAADGQCAPVLREFGEMLIDAGEFDAIKAEDTINGIVYLDDNGNQTNGTTDDVDTYDKIGANHEVYLEKGQAIALILTVDDISKLASIDIGAKTILESAGSTTMKVILRNTADADIYCELTQPVTSATAQFYDLATMGTYSNKTDGQCTLEEIFGAEQNGQFTAYLVITNAASNESNKSILSLTDLKLAFSSAPAPQVAFLSSMDLALFATDYIHNRTEGLSKAEDGNWYYYVNGAIDTSYNGLVGHTGNLWYVQNGQVIFTHNGMITFGGEQFYVKGGKVDTSVNSIQKRDGTWYYFTDGRVDTAMNGMIEKLGDLWYVNAGYVDFNKTGLVPYEGSLLYVRYGQHIANYQGLVKSEIGQWLYVNNGAVDYSYTGFAKRNGNWWYVVDGAVDFTFIGYVSDGNVKYFVEYGLVDASNPIYS